MNTLPADLLSIFTANASLLPGCSNLVRRPFSVGIRQLLRQPKLTRQVIRTGPARCVNALKRVRHQVSGAPPVELLSWLGQNGSLCGKPGPRSREWRRANA
jgi:hypothetical protein